MKRLKYNLKPLREMVGMTQQDLAKALSVDVRSVKRWERLDCTNEPPDEAWEILERLFEKQTWVIDTAIEQIEALPEGHSVQLCYWNEKSWAKNHPEEEPNAWHLANANNRAVARELMAFGYEVNFDGAGFEEIKALNGLI